MAVDLEDLTRRVEAGDRRAASELGAELRRVEGDAAADETLAALVALSCGNPTAMEVLVAALFDQRFARAAIRRVLFAEELVEEALQETALALVGALPTFRGDATFRTWASRIARNQAIAILRRRNRVSAGPPAARSMDGQGVGEPGRVRLDEASVASFSSMLSDRRDLQEALASLSPDLARAVRLRDVEQWTYAQIAAAEGIPINTVRSRLGRGRARLKLSLAASEPR